MDQTTGEAGEATTTKKMAPARRLSARRFARAYVQALPLHECLRLAGSTSTSQNARAVHACRLLRRPLVQKWIEHYQGTIEEMADDGIRSGTAALVGITKGVGVNGNKVTHLDVTNAHSALCRMRGRFIQRIEVDDKRTLRFRDFATTRLIDASVVPTPALEATASSAEGASMPTLPIVAFEPSGATGAGATEE
jgi:hypothetical protein